MLQKFQLKHENICWTIERNVAVEAWKPNMLSVCTYLTFQIQDDWRWGRRGRKSLERLETNLRSILLNSSWDSNPGHWAEPTLELSLCRSLRRTNISLFRLFIFLYLKVIMSYYSFNIIIFYYALTPFKLPGIGQDQSKNLSLLKNPFLFFYHNCSARIKMPNSIKFWVDRYENKKIVIVLLTWREQIFLF